MSNILERFKFLFDQEHSAICNKEDKDRVRVKVEKFRGEPWFDSEGKKMKISFEMNTSKELGRHSVAKTIVFGESSFHKISSLLLLTDIVLLMLKIHNHNFFFKSRKQIFDHFISPESWDIDVHFTSSFWREPVLVLKNWFVYVYVFRKLVYCFYTSRKPVCAWDRVNTWRSSSYSEGGDRKHSHRG